MKGYGGESLQIYIWATEETILESLIHLLPDFSRSLSSEQTQVVVDSLLINAVKLLLFLAASKGRTVSQEFAIEPQAILSVLLCIKVLMKVPHMIHLFTGCRYLAGTSNHDEEPLVFHDVSPSLFIAQEKFVTQRLYEAPCKPYFVDFTDILSHLFIWQLYPSVFVNESTVDLF